MRLALDRKLVLGLAVLLQELIEGLYKNLALYDPVKGEKLAQSDSVTEFAGEQATTTRFLPPEETVRKPQTSQKYGTR